MGRRPLGVALEEELPAEGEVISAEPGVDQLEQDLLETSEDLGEGVENDAQVDEAQAASGEIEDAVEVAEASEEKGGLDTVAAESLRILVNSACRRAGISSSGSMPAMESFGQAGRRLSNTRIAKEDWKDKVKEIWAKIVAALKRAWEWVVGYWNKFFGSAEKLQKRAEALEIRARELPAAKPEGELKNSSLAKALALNGKFAGAKEIASNLDLLTEFTKEYTGAFNAKIKGAEELSISADKIGNLEKFDAKEILLSTHSSDKYGSPKEGWGYDDSGEFLGGMTIVYYGPKTKPAPGLPALDAFGRIRASLTQYEGKSKEVTSDDLSIASGTEIETIAHAAAAVAKDAIAFRTAAKKGSETLKKVVDAANKATAAIEKESPEEGKQAEHDTNKALINAFKAAVAAQTKSLASDPAKIVTYIVRSASAAVQYGEACAAKYKK
jgi:hypothetical protein